MGHRQGEPRPSRRGPWGGRQGQVIAGGGAGDEPQGLLNPDAQAALDAACAEFRDDLRKRSLELAKNYRSADNPSPEHVLEAKTSLYASASDRKADYAIAVGSLVSGAAMSAFVSFATASGTNTVGMSAAFVVALIGVAVMFSAMARLAR